MSKRLFIILNIIYFALWVFGLPHFPSVPVFGWMPFQLFAHWLFGIAALIIWGLYLTRVTDKVTRYDSPKTDADAVKKATEEK